MKVTFLAATALLLTAWATPAAAGLLGDLIGPILPDPNPQPAPEIGVASARPAVALLVGSLLILRDRLRRS